MTEKIIQNPSITPNDFGYDGGAISSILGAPLVGAGGGTIIESDFVWLPSVTDEGVISWQRATSAIAPSTANIMGPQGNPGTNGTNGTDGKDGVNGTDGKDATPITATTTTAVGGTQVTISYTSGGDPLAQFTVLSGAKGADGQDGKDGKDGTNGTDGADGISPTFTITPTAGGTHVTISGAQGEDGFDVLSGAKGADGQNGQNGDAGFSPLFTITDVNTGTYTQGGKHVAIRYGDGGSQNTAFDILNGIDGTDSTVNLFGNNGVSVTKDGTNYTVGLSGGYYSDTLSAYSAMYAGYASNAKFSDNSVSAMDQIKGSIDWGNQIANEYATHSGNFVTSSSQVITGDKQYALTTTGWAEIDIPAVGGEYLPLSGGTVSGATYFSVATGQNILAVASAASLVGASRQTSANFGQNASALGTTWMGVGGRPDMYRGFFKYIKGGNAGALDSDNTMQVDFTPNNKGTIFAKAKNSGTDCKETQILNPIKASCDAMVQSANANSVSGPNYMLAKNADGQFVIGAACINCSAISDVTLSANTYYFVYEV